MGTVRGHLSCMKAVLSATLQQRQEDQGRIGCLLQACLSTHKPWPESGAHSPHRGGALDI